MTASAQLWLFPLGAILLGAASVSTPASSHILARVTPLRLAPLIFSIKQTGVPVGALIGGLLVPFLLALTFYSDTLGVSVRLGPYGASFVTCLIVFAVMVSLEPVRSYFDADRRPDMKIAFGDLPATLKTVLAIRPLRDLSFAAFAFGGLQALFSGFFILFLIDGLDYSAAEAGKAFAIASFSAVWARILWGALGGGTVSPRIIMAGIGLVAGLSAVATALYGAEWTFWEITAVAIVFNMTALSWHGILLAETARLAPEGQVGGVTGGVLAFTSIAMMIYPALYGGLLAWTGSYGIGFILGAIPSFAAFVIFINPPVDGAWTGLGVRFGRLLLSRRALARAGGRDRARLGTRRRAQRRRLVTRSRKASSGALKASGASTLEKCLSPGSIDEFGIGDSVAAVLLPARAASPDRHRPRAPAPGRRSGPAGPDSRARQQPRCRPDSR